MTNSICDRCATVVTNPYNFNGKTYGSTCIKIVLRKAGYKTSRKYGYLYNDASAIIQMLKADKDYYAYRFTVNKTQQKELYKKMKSARNMIGSQARHAISMANGKKGVTHSPCDDPRFWETYYLAKKMNDENCLHDKRAAEK